MRVDVWVHLANPETVAKSAIDRLRAILGEECKDISSSRRMCSVAVQVDARDLDEGMAVAAEHVIAAAAASGVGSELATTIEGSATLAISATRSIREHARSVHTDGQPGGAGSAQPVAQPPSPDAGAKAT